MGNILFAWEDTKPSRRNDSRLIVFLNDSNTIPRGIEYAFEKYNVSVIKWSERNLPKNLNQLTA